MANVDLVDLIPILKAILSIKKEYKIAIETGEDDFSLYPVLTENFLDTKYNQGYVIGYKQCWEEYLNNQEVEVPLQREMREVVASNYSLSGEADYDALTSIMRFCLSVRRNLKEILDLDTDLFELYPPQVISLGSSQYAAGLSDGYAQAYTDITNLGVTPPTIYYNNNCFTIQTNFPGGVTYYMIGTTGEWQEYDPNYPIYVPEGSTMTIYAYTNAGTKNSETVSKDGTYNSYLSPTIDFSNNTITINSNYIGDTSVVTMYKLSSWEGYNDFLPYDGLPIPIQYPTTIEAYNVFGDGRTSERASRYCSPEVTPSTERPATPVINFSDSNNVLSITCATQGASIYYQRVGSDAGWIPYTGPIKLSESGTFITMSTLGGVESFVSEAVTCTIAADGGTFVVGAPAIICSGNKVSVITIQNNVSLQIMRVTNTYSPDPANNISGAGWTNYTGTFNISRTDTYIARASLNNKEAFSVETECVYVQTNPGNSTNPGGGSGTSTEPYVAPPLIFYSNYMVSMTVVEPGSTIYYRTGYDSTWREYTTPITIEESTLFIAKAVKNGYESQNVELACAVEDEGVWKCYMDFTLDVLTITTNVTGGTIYYKTPSSDWTEYTGPIDVQESQYYYSKVMKNGYSSDIFALYCQRSDVDYNTVYLTLELEETGYVHIFTTGGTQNYDSTYFGYLNTLGRWAAFPANNALYWPGGTPLCIKSNIPVNKSDNRYFYINCYDNRELNPSYVNYIIYGNSASLLYGFPEQSELPVGVTINLGPDCMNSNSLIIPENKNWTVVKQYSSTPAEPTIDFNEETNVVTISCSGFYTQIQYKIDDGEWTDYNEQFNVYDDCTVYARAYNYSGSNYYYSTTSSETITVETIPSCTITYNNNIVSITCEDSEATIKYKKSTDSSWSDYESPFRISSTATYDAKAVKGNLESSVVSEECVYEQDLFYEYFTVEALENGIISIYDITYNSRPSYFSKNDGEWESLSEQVTNPVQISVSSGDKVRIKSVESRPADIRFNFSGRVNVYGNILSLYYGDNFASATPSNISFSGLFNGCNKLVDASGLVLTDYVAASSHTQMFYGCTSLTAAPELPATTLATSCYSGMFMNCSSLTAAPSLPATTLAESCYYSMFYGCTSLTTAPSLPATTLAEECYKSMFQGCTSLVTAPDLLATTTQYYCYEQMFYGCTSLNYIKCLATTRASYDTSNWTRNVASTGTFVKNSGATWSSGVDGIPSGWTVQEV